MMGMKILRIVGIILATVLVALLVFVMITVGTVDRTPAKEFDSYNVMMQRLDSLHDFVVPPPVKGFSAGFGKVNITPSFSTPLAGYGKRRGKHYTTVHDSIYVRTIVLNNGNQRVALVSADLLIIPPTVTMLLTEKLQGTGFTLDNVYLGATHTHNSIGNWGHGAARFIYGPYNEAIVNFIADKIVESVVMANKNLVSATLKSGNIAIPSAVYNRLIDNGPKDSLLRVVEIQRNDNIKLLFMSYTAHATCLFSRDLELSRDYPGKLVDNMESNGYDFAMFMAGAVGSHGVSSKEPSWSCIDETANTISDKFLSSKDQLQLIEDSVLFMKRVPLELSDPQVKVLENWKVRSWFFRYALGEYPVYLGVLRIGDVVMLNTPCDYSGEFNSSLDSVASQYGLKTIVTSFNGGYIGYITPEKYYDEHHYETQLMNWYAPGTGEFINENLKKLIQISAQQ
jgi:neutral ceramidase